jgi:non-homologous end joining protein Ku
MEKEQLIEVIGLYKQALADCIEEKFAYQSVVSKQARQIKELNEQMQNLMQQLQNKEGD